jgi:hypothetical protein
MTTNTAASSLDRLADTSVLPTRLCEVSVLTAATHPNDEPPEVGAVGRGFTGQCGDSVTGLAE